MLARVKYIAQHTTMICIVYAVRVLTETILGRALQYADTKVLTKP